MNIPIVSIIVPVYNVEKYLRSCLDSILAQTFTDWECVLVDDGSTDGSRSICDQYANIDERFVTIHKDNGGVSTARNYGIRTVKGQWITFVDADDELPKEAIDTMFSMVSASIDIVIAGYKKFNAFQEVTYEVTEKHSYIKNRNNAILEIYNPSYYSYLGYICSKLYKMEIIRQKNILFDESIFVSEDRLFLLTYLSVISGKVCFTTEPVYYYYDRNDSVMGNLKKEYNPKVNTEIIAMGKAYRLFKSHGFSQIVVKRARKEIIVSGNTILQILKSTKTDNPKNIFYVIKLMAQEAGWFYVICNKIESFVKHRWEKLWIKTSLQ